MKLKSYEVTNYKCIDSTGPINFNQQIALVGKNEAGKTATVTSLYKLNPIKNADGTFTLEEYPRKKLSSYKRIHETKPDIPIKAIFTLTSNELEEIEEEFGKDILDSSDIEISKPYGKNNITFTIPSNPSNFIKHLISKSGVPAEEKKNLSKFKNIKDLKEALNSSKTNFQGANFILDSISRLRDESLNLGIIDFLGKKSFVPKFFFFDDYAVLPGKISLSKLLSYKKTQSVTKDSGFETALALIELAGSAIEEFLNPENYERLKADLESASNSISEQLNKYWSQNKHLEIEFDLEKIITNNQLSDTILHVRVRNTKHKVTVPFDDRSKGFVWFFSFLVAFSGYEKMGNKVILLLDEPGLNLHAKAQQDLLKYFEKELLPNHQLAYTTHSPFMINPLKFDDIRIVEDKDDEGTKVSNDPLTGNSETLFPLQAALGFDLTQTLFVAPDNLLVEGPSDLIYLSLSSHLLSSKGKTGLSKRWTIVPTGGIDKIPAFVSLMGSNGLNIAILMDMSTNHNQKINNLLRLKLLEKKNIITVGGLLGTNQNADIEDLFTPESFLKLISLSYKNELSGKEITISDLKENDGRIVKKLEKYFADNKINNGNFSHYKPAYDLLITPSWLPEIFDDLTLSNFEKTFQEFNGILSKDFTNSNLPVQLINKLNINQGKPSLVDNRGIEKNQ